MLMVKNISFQNRDRFIQLGIHIASYRKMRGMSQDDLADKAGVSRSFLSNIEAPKKVQPFSLDVFFRIADALQVTPMQLIDTSHLAETIINESNA